MGSHTVFELYNAGHTAVIIDNLVNSKIEVLEKLKKILKVEEIPFIKGDVRNTALLEDIFSTYSIDAVIHFAGLKAVGESVKKPIEYYQNNLISTLNLTSVMKKFAINKLVFSSSATVYGQPTIVPITEDEPLGPTTNPYGTSKLFCEQILQDIALSDNSWNIFLLRYFNPIGAHESGLIGEDPAGIPNNLMPYLLKVATKQLPFLRVFGNDYDTKDGTGVRDYLHVVDLAKGHIQALKKLANNQIGIEAVNLGTGVGYSVLEVIRTFSKENNVEIPYKIESRRAGDLAEIFADPRKAKTTLNWVAEKNLVDMVRDSYRFAKKGMTIVT